VIGAAALGVRNILCVTGDSATLSPSPREKMEINDLDAIQMLWILRRMRDDGKYLDGRALKVPPKFFLGTAASPFSSNPKFQALREQKKVNAGAQFFQTNLVFDINGMEEWLNELAKRSVLDKVYILVGVTPLKSLKMALRLSEVPGVYLPKRIIDRMDYANVAGKAQEEGIQIALELIHKIKTFRGQGIHGIHLMPVGWDEVVPRIIREAGLLPKSYSVPLTSQERAHAHSIEK
jgi:methylenetetrahydrofolate reductase (NADPH)